MDNLLEKVVKQEDFLLLNNIPLSSISKFSGPTAEWFIIAINGIGRSVLEIVFLTKKIVIYFVQTFFYTNDFLETKMVVQKK